MRNTLLAAAVLWAGAAQAQEARDLCPTRPGLGTTACVTEVGRVVAELGVGDWTLERSDGERTDTILTGDLLLRTGIGPTTEVQLGFTTLGRVRERDSAGSVDRMTRVGDVTLAVRQNLRNPDGTDLSFGVQPFVTLPAGRRPVGGGTWGTGVIVPVDYELPGGIQLQLSPEVDATPNEDGQGRHVTYGNVFGIEFPLGRAAELDLEVSAFRDHEPGDHSTELLAAAAFDWKPTDDLQLDIGSAFGLNRQSPDVRIYAGITRRF